MDIRAIIFDFEKAPDAKTRETLCKLRRRGYKLAANCACGACDVVFESGEEGERTCFLRAAELLHVPPHTCAVVECACERLLAAKDSGMKTIGVLNAKNCIYADTCINDFSELTDIFA
ncbi:MAG: hypothetical protein IJW76_03895 [Clostridia bacterium]|nr:hypothetical protein [Clostridia bacterium]